MVLAWLASFYSDVYAYFAKAVRTDKVGTYRKIVNRSFASHQFPFDFIANPLSYCRIAWTARLNFV